MEYWKSKEATQKHIDDQLNDPEPNNLKLIKSYVEDGKYGGKICLDPVGKPFYVVAATSTFEDYYYLGFTGETKLSFISGVGKLNPLESSEIPVEMNIVRWMVENTPKAVVDRVKRFVDNCEYDVLFTKINIEGVLY